MKSFKATFISALPNLFRPKIFWRASVSRPHTITSLPICLSVISCLVLTLYGYNLLYQNAQYTLYNSTFIPQPQKQLAVTSTIQSSAKKEPEYPTNLTMSVKSGDTLMSMLLDKGVSQSEAHHAIESMKKVYNPQKLAIGQSMHLQLDKKPETNNNLSISGLSIAVSPLKTIALSKASNDSFKVKEIKAAIFKGMARAGGTIHNSLYQTGIEAGIPANMLADIIKAYSYDVDFQRDIKEGDELDVVFERLHTDKNVTAGYGNIIYASLTLSGKELTIYRHESPDGFASYYNAKGESVKKALLRTPINGAHISSGFGLRMHPILGYSKMHKGVDFAAVTGTPIYAAGDGVIEEAGRKGGYGNYVRVRHNNNYATAYGHASRIAKGIRAGAHVKQGQIIAYVGSTGQSTGPHLHYEILANGTQVNPSGVKFRTGQTLQGKELASYKKLVNKIQLALEHTPRNTQMAQLDLLPATTSKSSK